MSEKTSGFLFITENEKPAVDLIPTMRAAEFDAGEIKSYKAVVIEYNDYYRDVFKKIRMHHDPEVYLKPAFLHNPNGIAIIDYGKEIIDGINTSFRIDDYLSSQNAVIDEIGRRVDGLRKDVQSGIDSQYALAVKAIRLLYSRNKKLTPVRFPKSIYGYSYPLINVLFNGNSYQEFYLVDFMKNRNLIDGVFIDRLQSCNQCYSSFINFREVCTACGSADISGEDLVHHFHCGYVGPESDFIDDEHKSSCPKCRKKLNHIGVDYDRPSQIFTCSKCQHVFQEPNISTLCFNCSKESKPSDLIIRDIREFTLSALGEISAVNGIVFSLKDEFLETVDLVDMKHFKLFVSVELERIKRYKKTTSTVVSISFENYLEIIARFGKASDALTRQIAQEINKIIRPTDVAGFFNDNTILLILAETDLEGATTAIGRFTTQIVTLVRENIGIELKVSSNTVSLNQSAQLNDVLTKLNIYG